MFDSNQNQSNQNQSSPLQPTVHIQADVPPMPNFSNPSAPSDFFPPNVPNIPKKRFGRGKIIATFLGILLLIGGVTAGIISILQPQLFNQKAVPALYDMIPCESKVDQGCMSNSSYCKSPNCVPGTGICANQLNPYCAKFVNNTGLPFCVAKGDGALSTTFGAIHCVFAGTTKDYYQCPIDKPFYQPTSNICTGTNVGGTGSSCQGTVPRYEGNTDSNSITIDPSWVESCTNTCLDATLYASKCVCPDINMTSGCNTGCTIETNLSAKQIITFPQPPACGTTQIDIGCKNTYKTFGTFTFASKTYATACGGTPKPTNPPVNPPPTSPPTKPPITLPPSPTPSPSPTPVLSCTGLGQNITSPVLGSQVTFTCKSSQVSGSPVAYFRWQVNSGVWQEDTTASNVNLTNLTATRYAPVTINSPGAWTVQCRVCRDTTKVNCTQWGLAN